MLVINSVEEYNDRLHEIRYSTDSVIGMAERYADFYQAVCACPTLTADGRFYIFALHSKEYMQARWYFKQAVALAYPEANPADVYGYWLTHEDVTVGQCVTAVLAKHGEGYYTPWS